MKTLASLMAYSLLFVAFTSCSNEDDHTPNPVDQLPPATQIGENTFGCLVDGEPFVVTNTNNLVALYQQGVLFIGGEKNLNNLSGHISLLVENTISQSQTYILAGNTSSQGEYYLEGCFYITNPTYIGTLEITYFDTINYIISGKFEFTAITDACENDDMVSITDGRFDLQYIP